MGIKYLRKSIVYVPDSLTGNCFTMDVNIIESDESHIYLYNII